MSFGLCKAPATIERVMETLIAGTYWQIFFIYLDNIVRRNAEEPHPRIWPVERSRPKIEIPIMSLVQTRSRILRSYCFLRRNINRAQERSV